jgi:hypothetical protein
MNSVGSEENDLGRFRQAALAVGGVGLAACLAGFAWDRGPALHSYLFAFVFWTGVGLGGMAILMLHHMVGGRWGFALRRPLEAAARTLRWMALFAIPLGMLYFPYLDRLASVGVDGHPLVPFKRAYLNPSFFGARTVIYFAVWVILASSLEKWSAIQDRTGSPDCIRRLQSLSGPGLVIYGLTVTYASVDWIMSLEPTWFSTIYGMIIMVTQALAAMAVVTVTVALLGDRKPLPKILTPLLFNDFGNLLFTFTMLWAYLSFSQYLIIWSGNLPDETQWYRSRASGGWAGIAVLLIVFHFAVPFVLLLMRFIKRRARVLAAVAAGLVVMSAVDMYWLTVPAFASDRSGPSFHWTDGAAWFGIGGVWLWGFITHLDRQPLVPLNDPRLEGVVLND